MRIVSPKYDLFYSVWCTNEHELYDMKVGSLLDQFDWPKTDFISSQTDPYQTINLYGTASQFQGHPIGQVTSRLDALLMILKTCKAEQCTTPWLTLHPGGQIRNLAEALDSTLDAFYGEEPKVSYTKCELGYIASSEGPMEVVPWHIGD